MATRYGRQAYATWRIKTSVSSDVVLDAELDPDQELEPFRLSAYEPGTWRMRKGWPHAVPTYDVRTTGEITGDAIVTTDRPLPSEITTNARARWVAGDTFNAGTGTWNRTHSDFIPAKWESSGYQPELVSNFSYVYDKQVIVVDALSFTGETSEHMWSNFGSNLNGNLGYTIIMVLSLNTALNPEIVEDDDDDELSGLIVPVSAGTGDPSLRMKDNYLQVQRSPTKSYVTGTPLFTYQNASRPIYLAFVVGAPAIRTWIGLGPKSLKGHKYYYPYPSTTQNMALYLGRTAADTTHTASMLLFDVGVYDTRLREPDVAKEIAILAKSYGGK